MTSWRDSASPGAQDDLDGLLDTALPFALEMLKQHGEFLPCAFVLEQSGETRMLAGAPRKGEHPASMDISAFLFECLGEQRDGLRAIAVVRHVRQAQSDAVRVDLEHQEGTALVVSLPYHRLRLRRGIAFGELAVGPAPRKVWEL